MYVCVCISMYVCVCVYVDVRACMIVCVHMCVHVLAVFIIVSTALLDANWVCRLVVMLCWPRTWGLQNELDALCDEHTRRIQDLTLALSLSETDTHEAHKMLARMGSDAAYALQAATPRQSAMHVGRLASLNAYLQGSRMWGTFSFDRLPSFLFIRLLNQFRIFVPYPLSCCVPISKMSNPEHLVAANTPSSTCTYFLSRMLWLSKNADESMCVIVFPTTRSSNRFVAAPRRGESHVSDIRDGRNACIVIVIVRSDRVDDHVSVQPLQPSVSPPAERVG
jgi:hypothetical protein